MILLDTHAWLWWVSDRGKLSPKARRRIEVERELAVSAISCWEIGMLVERGRLKLRTDTRSGIREALSVPRLRVVAVDEAIAAEAGLLGSGFHGDPADRIIVATALELRTTLVTKDPNIRESKVVTTLW